MITYKFSIAKRNRTCKLCSEQILAGSKHFIQTELDRTMPFPQVSNICNFCAKSITDNEFLIYLEELFTKLKGLRMQYEARKKSGDIF